MSKHHHHPHEGHGEGNPPEEKPLRHNWFFYIAGFFILVALVCFILSNNLNYSPSALPPPSPSSSGR